jgi:hypothetical protein
MKVALIPNPIIVLTKLPPAPIISTQHPPSENQSFKTKNKQKKLKQRRRKESSKVYVIIY